MPYYIGVEEAVNVLAEIGIDLSVRQIKRAAETDGSGRRKLPFFVDPIDKRLKIDKGTLLNIYTRCQFDAESSAQLNPAERGASSDLHY